MTCWPERWCGSRVPIHHRVNAIRFYERRRLLPEGDPQRAGSRNFQLTIQPMIWEIRHHDSSLNPLREQADLVAQMLQP